MNGNYFSKKEKMKPSMALNLCDDTRSSWVSMCVIIRVPKYFWWLCALYELIDASTDACEEEEAEVYEEEEEPCANCTNCVNCTNQGKLILVQARKDTLQFIT